MPSDVTALSHEVVGTVRLGVIGTAARWLVPQLIELAPERHPLLHLVFIEATTIGLDVPARERPGRPRRARPARFGHRAAHGRRCSRRTSCSSLPQDHPLADAERSCRLDELVDAAADPAAARRRLPRRARRGGRGARGCHCARAPRWTACDSSPRSPSRAAASRILPSGALPRYLRDDWASPARRGPAAPPRRRRAASTRTARRARAGGARDPAPRSSSTASARPPACARVLPTTSTRTCSRRPGSFRSA